MQEGEQASLVDLNLDQHFTQPPPRFTEAMLVKTLEELGIGRPSTYAPIIDTIVRRGYVRLEDKRCPHGAWLRSRGCLEGVLRQAPRYRV